MEKCSNCEYMKKENTTTRKALMETNKNYVEVVNENLALRRELEEIKVAVAEMKALDEEQDAFKR